MDKAHETLWQITAPHFCAGVVVVSNVVTEAAPILKWTIGKPWREVREYAKSKGWHGSPCVTVREHRQ